MLMTTLAAIRAAQPCESSYGKFLKFMGTGYPERKRFPLLLILASNGPYDVEWVLESVKGAGFHAAAREFSTRHEGDCNDTSQAMLLVLLDHKPLKRATATRRVAKRKAAPAKKQKRKARAA